MRRPTRVRPAPPHSIRAGANQTLWLRQRRGAAAHWGRVFVVRIQTHRLVAKHVRAEQRRVCAVDRVEAQVELDEACAKGALYDAYACFDVNVRVCA